jgi:hypothetical protein
MAVKPEQQPTLTHEQRVERLQQLTNDLARAVDLAEEQRRMLRDIARDATDLADAISAAPEPPHPSAAPGRQRRKKR